MPHVPITVSLIASRANHGLPRRLRSTQVREMVGKARCNDLYPTLKELAHEHMPTLVPFSGAERAVSKRACRLEASVSSRSRMVCRASKHERRRGILAGRREAVPRARACEPMGAARRTSHPRVALQLQGRAVVGGRVLVPTREVCCVVYQGPVPVACGVVAPCTCGRRAGAVAPD